MKHRYPLLLSVVALLIFLSSCSQPPIDRVQATATATATPTPTPATGPSSTIPGGQLYSDAKLGFHLTIPPDWQAHPEPGSQAEAGNAYVQFTTDDEQNTRSLIIIGVFHSSTMPAAFAQRGTPSTRVGPYPAFVADRNNREGRAPCLVRIFLAGNDYVLADWCAPDVAPHQAQFEQVLATYLPAPDNFVPQATTPAAKNCTDMQHMLGYGQVGAVLCSG